MKESAETRSRGSSLADSRRSTKRNGSEAYKAESTNETNDFKHVYIDDNIYLHALEMTNISKADSMTTELKIEDEDERVYLTGFPLVMITLGLCLTIFMIALDNTIIATAIPTITTHFNSLPDVGWYGSAYLLTTTSLQPSFGKLYTFFNLKIMYISAIVVFELGSLICALATSSIMLIIGRAIAGLGAAGLFSGAMIIIAFSVPLRKRAIFVASLSSMFGIASIIGPILGGVLTDKASWRWCFWINLPVGAISVITIYTFFHNPKRPEQDYSLKKKINELDILGASVFVCAVICLLLALQWGGTKYQWNSARIVALFVLFGLLSIAFSVIQVMKGDFATLPPRILGQRTVLWGALFSLFFGMALYTHIYFLPFYFQAVKNKTAEGSGIASIPYLISNTVASLVVGGIVTAVGWYVPFMWGSSAIFTLACGLLYTLRVDSSTAKWIGYQILAGAGSGAGVQLPYLAVQVVLADRDLPAGNSVIIFFQSLGGAVSISAAQNIFTNTLRTQIPQLAPGVDADSVISAGATHLREVVSAKDLADVLVAYTRAIDASFILPIVVASVSIVCSLFMEMRSLKEKRTGPVTGA